MKHITDTDFLPSIREVSVDVYRLVYGVIVLRWEARIYDTLVIMCRKYPDAPLRRAKINAWKSAVEIVIDKLKEANKEECRVYIPYLNLLTTPTNLLNLYGFTLDALTELYRLERIEYRKGTSKETVQGYYPIPELTELMRSFAAQSKENGDYCEDIDLVIESELAKRGLVESSSPKPSQSYQEIFFSEGKVPTFTPPDIHMEREEDKTPDLLIKTGFLYYALKGYLEEAYKSRSQKEYVIDTLLKRATVRIASGLFNPNEPIKGHTSEISGNTFYQYVYSRKFDDKGTKRTGENNKKIKELLDDFCC